MGDVYGDCDGDVDGYGYGDGHGDCDLYFLTKKRFPLIGSQEIMIFGLHHGKTACLLRNFFHLVGVHLRATAHAVLLVLLPSNKVGP